MKWWSDLKKVKAEDELERIKDMACKSLGEVAALTKEKRALIEEVETLKLQKRLETEEIKHNTKLVEAAAKNDLEREKILLQEKYSKDISAFKEEQRKQLVESLKEFHTKIEARFDSELQNMKAIYQMLTEKLPNVNFAFTKDLGGFPASGQQVIEAKNRK